MLEYGLIWREWVEGPWELQNLLVPANNSVSWDASLFSYENYTKDTPALSVILVIEKLRHLRGLARKTMEIAAHGLYMISRGRRSALQEERSRTNILTMQRFHYALDRSLLYVVSWSRIGGPDLANVFPILHVLQYVPFTLHPSASARDIRCIR